MRRVGRYTKERRVRSAWYGTNKYILWFRNLNRWQKAAVILIPIFTVMLLIPLLTYAYFARDIANVERLMNRNNTGIVISAKNGEVLYRSGKAKHRDVVPLNNINKHVVDALISSEDKDFYKHKGFNPVSILRAAVTRHGGGSTITQQLAKNTLLSSEQTFMRKYQELFVSIAIENHYKKDEILAMYLNSVYYGEDAFGIEDAAQIYFGKKPADLTLAESAMLIGVLPAPTKYSPISGSKEYAKERQKVVLERMVKNGKITNEQKVAAASEELAYASKEESSGIKKAPHFVQQVIRELKQRYGEEKVARSGYQVTTTLDPNIQSVLENQINTNMASIRAQGGSNAGAIAIEPSSGEVQGYVGSYDYNDKDFGNVDMVQATRQPGSSFKPIYYAGALADGTITPATIFEDKATTFPGSYQPKNALRTYNGDVTVRRALAWSLNIPAVKIMEKYGVGKAVRTAQDLGITTLSRGTDYGLSLALGAGEARLQEMTGAYAVFANGGKKNDVTKVIEIKDKYDKYVQRKTTPKNAPVMSEQGAYLISNILSDNEARSGMFGRTLSLNGKKAAVKTGTTDSQRDAWTIGYTPDIAIGVWVGNNDNSVMNNGGGGLAGPIWRGAMNSLAGAQSGEVFKQPGGIVTRDVCRGDGKLAQQAGANTYKEVFLSTALPDGGCNATKKEEKKEETPTQQQSNTTDNNATDRANSALRNIRDRLNNATNNNGGTNGTTGNDGTNGTGNTGTGTGDGTTGNTGTGNSGNTGNTGGNTTPAPTPPPVDTDRVRQGAQDGYNALRRAIGQ